MVSFYKLWEEIQLIPSYFGTPGTSFPAPPLFWVPAHMDVYPKDAMQACYRKMEQLWPGSSPQLTSLAQAVANYVYYWSLNRKNVYKRIISNAGEQGLNMEDILEIAKKADRLAQSFSPRYPSPIAIPNNYQQVYQMAKKVAV